MRFISIEKVPFSMAALGLLAILFSGFATFRPNRIAAGQTLFLWQTRGEMWIAVLFLWAVLLVVCSLELPRRRRLPALGALTSVLIPMLMFTAGRHAALTAEAEGSVVRVSLGPAFWISLFALIAIFTDAVKRSKEEKKAVLLLALAGGSCVLFLLLAGYLDMLSIMREFANRKDRFFGELQTHMILVGASVGLALLLGVPIGLLAYRKKTLYNPTFFILNTLQTVPSLAVFGILIPVLAALTSRFPFLSQLGIRGIGAAPAIIALTVYSLLPVARNTYTGFATVDQGVIEAGTGMGMTRLQLLLSVEIPIASPVILNGIRVALVQAVGLTAVAALIGAGGLGVFIFQGLGQAADDLILLGAMPTIVIAVIADSMMNGIILFFQPKGLR